MELLIRDLHNGFVEFEAGGIKADYPLSSDSGACRYRAKQFIDRLNLSDPKIAKKWTSKIAKALRCF